MKTFRIRSGGCLRSGDLRTETAAGRGKTVDRRPLTLSVQSNILFLQLLTKLGKLEDDKRCNQLADLEVGLTSKLALICATELLDALKSFNLTSLKIKVAPYPKIVSQDTLIPKLLDIEKEIVREVARGDKPY